MTTILVQSWKQCTRAVPLLLLLILRGNWGDKSSFRRTQSHWLKIKSNQCHQKLSIISAKICAQKNLNQTHWKNFKKKLENYKIKSNPFKLDNLVQIKSQKLSVQRKKRVIHGQIRCIILGFRQLHQKHLKDSLLDQVTQWRG